MPAVKKGGLTNSNTGTSGKSGGKSEKKLKSEAVLSASTTIVTGRVASIGSGTLLDGHVQPEVGKDRSILEQNKQPGDICMLAGSTRSYVEQRDC